MFQLINGSIFKNKNIDSQYGPIRAMHIIIAFILIICYLKNHLSLCHLKNALSKTPNCTHSMFLTFSKLVSEKENYRTDKRSYIFHMKSIDSQFFFKKSYFMIFYIIKCEMLCIMSNTCIYKIQEIAFTCSIYQVFDNI